MNVRPIVFLGPSMPLDEAKALLDADYRPPCKRGDLGAVPSGSVVGLIDGVFHQDDAVSPRELVFALERGVIILGAASMGALRAAEVPGVVGVGRIYEMYASGSINSDDEVALVFDPETFTPRTVPLINVRHALERLTSAGTLDRRVAQRMLEAAIGLHYRDRTYRRILQRAGIASREETGEVVALLSAFDLKNSDARLLLERLPEYARERPACTEPSSSPPVRPDYGPADAFGTVRARDRLDANAPILVWEIGGPVRFDALVTFLKLTGRFEQHARNALFRFVVAGGRLTPRDVPQAPDQAAVKALLAQTFHAWGWNTTEEVNVTLDDLGVGFKDLLARLQEETVTRAVLRGLTHSPPPLFHKALRAELLLDDLALKRETMRCSSLDRLAERGRRHEVVGEADLRVARKVLCRLHGGAGWAAVRTRIVSAGVSEEAVEAFVRTLASARRAAADLARPGIRGSSEALARLDVDFGLESSPKPEHEPRFSLSVDEAYAHALRLKEVIGVTRVAMITRLSELAGFHVSQAARPSGAWSSSYGSGKGTTEEGAVVGAIMEETEKWAQEQFTGTPVWSSYADLRERVPTLDPRLLDLPYDSRYHEDLEIAWHEATDLLAAQKLHVPLAALACSFHAGKNNIAYSPRGARVTFSTNGLASGFTLAEALVHGTCEAIERHAVRMAELRVENPGTSGRVALPRRIALGSFPRFVQDLAEQIRSSGCELDVWDITSEVRVPTVYVRLIADRELARGWATHPNPAIAVQMALLEAGQTVVAAIAAGREDLIIKARSLGRHERANPLRGAAQAYWEDPDAPTVDFAQMQDPAGSLISNDPYREFCFVREKLIEAGVSHLIAIDLTREEMRPAHAVRVVIPGLETNNPYYTGPRAQAALLDDMLPWNFGGHMKSPRETHASTADLALDRKQHRASLLVRHSDPTILQRDGVSRSVYAQIYEGGAPWDVARPQPAIVELEAEGKIRGSVLDVGCGTGDIALFLAAKNYQVLGIDFVASVVEKARSKARELTSTAEFLEFDALDLAELARSFETVIDSATFHTFSDEHRRRYAKALREVVAAGGTLHLLCFSDREPYRGGPRHVSAAEIRGCFEDGWDVVSVRETRYITTIVPEGARAWLAEIRRA